jgi:hypothetical protein
MRLVLLDATRSWLSPLSFCLGIIKANHRISIKDYYLVAEDDSNRPRIPHGFQPVPVRREFSARFGARCGTLPM